MRWSAVVLMVAACGGSGAPPAAPPTGARPPDPEPQARPESPEPEAEAEPAPDPEATEPTGPTLALACGRATARLPAGWTLVAEGARPCINPGYPMPIEATGVGGGESEHELTKGECGAVVVAREMPLDTARARERWSDAARTPEGSALPLTIRLDGCGDSEEATLRSALRSTLAVAPLTGGHELRFDISSSGHAIAGQLPEGYSVTSVGGMSDQWETAYWVRGSGEAFAAIYTRWYFEEVDGPQRRSSGRFREALLPRRLRWRASPEPWSQELFDEEPRCQMAAIEPEPRLRVSLYLCGSEGEHEALLGALRGLRFTEARDPGP